MSSANDNPDLLTSAYEDQKGKATVVVMNRSTSPQHLVIAWSGKQWTEIERTSPYLENAVQSSHYG